MAAHGAAWPAGTVLAFSAEVALADLQQGLIAHYPFSGDARDQGNGGYHGEVHGARPAPDRFGRCDEAYEFDGWDDYISVSGGVLGLDQGDFTIALWIDPASHAESYHDALVVRRGPGSRNGWFTSLIGKKREGYRSGSLFYQVSGGEIDPKWQSKAKVSRGEWRHVAYVYERGSQQLNVYLDGKRDRASKKVEPPVTRDAGLEMTIGRDSSGPKYHYHGRMDDLRIYGRALGASEIGRRRRLRRAAATARRVAPAVVAARSPGCLLPTLRTARQSTTPRARASTSPGWSTREECMRGFGFGRLRGWL